MKYLFPNIFANNIFYFCSAKLSSKKIPLSIGDGGGGGVEKGCKDCFKDFVENNLLEAFQFSTVFFCVQGNG